MHVEREREREIYFMSHISLWEHSSHFRLIGRGVPSVSVVSQLVYKFLCGRFHKRWWEECGSSTTSSVPQTSVHEEVLTFQCTGTPARHISPKAELSVSIPQAPLRMAPTYLSSGRHCRRGDLRMEWGPISSSSALSGIWAAALVKSTELRYECTCDTTSLNHCARLTDCIWSTTESSGWGRGWGVGRGGPWEAVPHLYAIAACLYPSAD